MLKTGERRLFYLISAIVIGLCALIATSALCLIEDTPRWKAIVRSVLTPVISFEFGLVSLAIGIDSQGDGH